MRTAKGGVSDVASHTFRAQINQHQMRVSAACDDVQTTLDQLIGKRLGVFDNLFLISFELRAQRLAECHSLTRDDMHQRTTLDAGEDGRVTFLGNRFVVGDDETTAWTAQGFMRG